MGVLFAIHANPAGAISVDGLGVGTVGLEFHGVPECEVRRVPWLAGHLGSGWVLNCGQIIGFAKARRAWVGLCPRHSRPP